MDKARVFKKECDDWTKLYHKTLKGLKAMIDMQKQVQNMIKIVEEMNTTIMKIEDTILKASINNQTINTMNILGISEDLQHLIQNNMKYQAYQVQWMLADELDEYR